MTAAEESAQLMQQLAEERAKSAKLEAENQQVRAWVEQILRRLGEAEGKLAKDSHKSSKPPSSDGLGRKRPHRRSPSEKKTEGDRDTRATPYS